MTRKLTAAIVGTLMFAASSLFTSAAHGQGFDIDFGRVVGGIVEGAARDAFQGGPSRKVTDEIRPAVMPQGRGRDQVIREIGSIAMQILGEADSGQYHNDYCDGRGSERPPIVRPKPGSEAEQNFLAAQVALKNRNYVTALKHADKADELLPENHDVQQLRSLIFFAQGRYRESASLAYIALHLGPGWNWKTVHKLMGSVDHYNESYQVLGKAAKNNPDSVDYHFLLGYHYLMLGHIEAGRKEMLIVDQLIPSDRLVTNILGALSANESVASK